MDGRARRKLPRGEYRQMSGWTEIAKRPFRGINFIKKISKTPEKQLTKTDKYAILYT